MFILFQPTCFSSSGSDHFNINKINYQFFSTVFVSFVSSCLCFPAHPPFFFEDSYFFIKYPFYYGSLSILLPSCSYPVILMKILTELLVRHSSFFSSAVDSIQALGLIISFSLFQMPSHASAPLNYSHLAIHLFRSAQDISKIRVPLFFRSSLSRGCYLIQVILFNRCKSLFKIVQRCFLLSGP